ncbi:MAG: hypothetical protein ACKVVP_04280, partial [Chloroflexota bacterium]
MPGPFDTTTKFLVQTYPRDWLTYLGLAGPGPVTVIDADLSTVTAEADKVLLLHEPSPYLVHLEFQASPDARMGQRLARYNLLLGYRHALPVASALVLLRPEAQSPGMTGQWRSAAPGGGGTITFEYSVLRIWEEPGERLLAGPLGLVPLAPLADIPRADLPE